MKPIPTDPHFALSRFRRLYRAYHFIRDRAREGSMSLERTKSKFVGPAFGLSPETIKRMKARYRNELSFGEGEGK